MLYRRAALMLFIVAVVAPGKAKKLQKKDTGTRAGEVLDLGFQSLTVMLQAGHADTRHVKSKAEAGRAKTYRNAQHVTTGNALRKAGNYIYQIKTPPELKNEALSRKPAGVVKIAQVGTTYYEVAGLHGSGSIKALTSSSFIGCALVIVHNSRTKRGALWHAQPAQQQSETDVTQFLSDVWDEGVLEGEGMDIEVLVATRGGHTFATTANDPLTKMKLTKLTKKYTDPVNYNSRTAEFTPLAKATIVDLRGKLTTAGIGASGWGMGKDKASAYYRPYDGEVVLFSETEN